MSKQAYSREQTRRRLSGESERESSLSQHPFAAVDQAATPGATVDTGHDFGQIAVQPAPAAAPQMKLRVSQRGDAHEQEADQVAEQVMRMPDAAAASDGDTPTHAPTPEYATADTIPSGGQPLDATARAYMEPRFGHDFGHVRVHTDEQAAEAASGYHARAYTVGSDIVFGAQEYAPDTSAGQHLLAHELTHVVQQESDATAAATVQRDEPEGGTAVADAAPGDVPAIHGMGNRIRPDQMKSAELASGIMHKQYAILIGWDTALERFDKVLSSSSDKEAKPDFASAITTFVGQEVLGDLLKLATDSEVVGWGFKLLVKMKEEAERAEKAEQSARIRDFYVQHKTAIGELKQTVFNNIDEFGATVRVLEEEATGEMSGSGSKGGKGKKGKGKWGVDTSSDATKVLDEYWLMRQSLMDAFTQLDAREKTSTPQNLFMTLSEEWIRHAEHRTFGGHYDRAVLDLYVNADFTVKQAHIQGQGGQKIAEQLIKDAEDAGLSGVDLLHMEVPKTVSIKFSEDDYPVWLSLDAMNRDLTRSKGYPQKEADAEAAYRALMSHGLALTKEVDGD